MKLMDPKSSVSNLNLANKSKLIHCSPKYKDYWERLPLSYKYASFKVLCFGFVNIQRVEIDRNIGMKFLCENNFTHRMQSL